MLQVRMHKSGARMAAATVIMWCICHSGAASLPAAAAGSPEIISVQALCVVASLAANGLHRNFGICSSDCVAESVMRADDHSLAFADFASAAMHSGICLGQHSALRMCI